MIWVDGDACPNPIKEILYRAAQRTQTKVIIVANHSIRIPVSHYISQITVEKGFDMADNAIVERAEKGDLVITSDIPLANELIELGASVITSVGERLTANNIKARLNIRDFMETLRASGQHTGGPAPLSKADRTAFANALDQWLTNNR